MLVFDRLNINMTTVLDKEQVLSRLKTNKEEHEKIYKEAVFGFKERCEKQLSKALEKCNGTEDIYLSLRAPRNYGSAYETAIEMVEFNKREEIELSANEFAMFMQDRWDWMDDFLNSSIDYNSSMAIGKAFKTGKKK